MASTPFRRLLHWGPISVLCIIKLITWSMIHLLGQYWPPHASLGGAIHAGVFLTFAGATLYYFLQSLLEGPGFIPLGWRPEKKSDGQYLQYCLVCEGFKAPRSHHCRKCGHCVMKMDHHCPWINCCVGHANHCYFTLFILSAVLGCSQASVVLSICMYHAINRVVYLHSGTGQEPIIYLTLTTLLLTLLAIGMAFGVVLAVGALFYLQVRGILRNRTAIEDWILEKAVSRRQEHGLAKFVFPYDMGWRENIRQVYHSTQYDGIHWPVREGCGPYDLTTEQIAQKAEKRVRSVLVQCVRAYSGRWLPLRAFPRAALAPPCSDDPRLALAPGRDLLRVTRTRSHWLFGEKVSAAHSPPGRGPRGWFPRDAVVTVDQCREKPD